MFAQLGLNVLCRCRRESRGDVRSRIKFNEIFVCCSLPLSLFLTQYIRPLKFETCLSAVAKINIVCVNILGSHKYLTELPLMEFLIRICRSRRRRCRSTQPSLSLARRAYSHISVMRFWWSAFPFFKSWNSRSNKNISRRKLNLNMKLSLRCWTRGVFLSTCVCVCACEGW